MRTPLIKLSVLLILATISSITKGQPPLDEYIALGLKNNIVLQQKNISLEKATLSLKIANGMFMPTVALQGNYTSGKGGRSISIPVGDMLNPVYSTLNQLTDSNQFPQIENVNQNFFPYDFYDAKVHTTVPIINTNLIYNRKIQQQQTMLQQFEQEIYARELVRDIKVAYYNYQNAQKGIEIYQSAMTRAAESRRVNESLVNNGKGLAAYILRSESEIETTRALLIDAEQQAHNAKLYFNFLLNREAEDSIRMDATAELRAVQLNPETSVLEREELKQIQTAVGLNETILKMNKLYWSPKIGGFLDLGSQAQNWKWDSNSQYHLFGFTADIPVFAGFTNKHKITQSQLDVRHAQLNYSLVSQQLKMSSQMARNSLVSAYQNYTSAQKQLNAAQSYQKLIDKGYKEGVNTFIESIDARNQFTSAQLQVNINLYKVLIAEANLERETAQYPLNLNSSSQN